MCQGFSHFSVFLLRFALAKSTTSSTRVNNDARSSEIKGKQCVACSLTQEVDLSNKAQQGWRVTRPSLPSDRRRYWLSLRPYAVAWVGVYRCQELFCLGRKQTVVARVSSDTEIYTVDHRRKPALFSLYRKSVIDSQLFRVHKACYLRKFFMCRSWLIQKKFQYLQIMIMNGIRSKKLGISW